jgi:hypothetical protein
MKKPSTRIVVRPPRGPLFSLASAWRAAETLGERGSEPAPLGEPACGPSLLPRRPSTDATDR